jgi:hypothetical protein
MANLPDAWVEVARNLDNAEQSTMQSQNSIERSPPERRTVSSPGSSPRQRFRASAGLRQ